MDNNNHFLFFRQHLRFLCQFHLDFFEFLFTSGQSTTQLKICFKLFVVVVQLFEVACFLLQPSFYLRARPIPWSFCCQKFGAPIFAEDYTAWCALNGLVSHLFIMTIQNLFCFSCIQLLHDIFFSCLFMIVFSPYYVLPEVPRCTWCH